MKKNSGIWKLIQRYVVSNSSPEDRRRLKRWMDQHPSNEQLVKQVKNIWDLTPEEDFDVNVQDAWERFRHRKVRENDRHAPVYQMQKQLRKAVYLFRAAAVILVAALTGLFVQYYASTSETTEEAAHFYVMQDLVTERGEKARVTFSDGTQVTLNAASSLRFPKKFQGPKREVYLDGEAYFKVAHNPEHPFIVHAGTATVQVLGTEFNVRGWSEDQSVDIAVREGKVAVDNASDSSQDASEVVLTQGQFTRVEKGKEPIPARDVVIRNYLLWTSGGLHFDNVPFHQVLRDLERKFDVHISVADTEVLDVPFTSTFRDAKLDEVLRVIAASMEMGYQRTGDKIEFNKHFNQTKG